jgi:hypothetical protein
MLTMVVTEYQSRLQPAAEGCHDEHSATGLLFETIELASIELVSISKCITKDMNLEKTKRLIIWNGGRTELCAV